MIGLFLTSCYTIDDAVYLDEDAKNTLGIEEKNPVIKASHWQRLCKFASEGKSFDSIIETIDKTDAYCIENDIFGAPNYYSYERNNILKEYRKNKVLSVAIQDLDHYSKQDAGILFFLRDPFFAFRYSTHPDIPQTVHIETVRLLGTYYGMFILYQTDQGEYVCMVDFVENDEEGYETWLAYTFSFDDFCEIAPKMCENGADGAPENYPIGGSLNARKGLDLSSWEVVLPSVFTQ